MRRLFLCVLGGLEVAVAVALIVISQQLPTRTDVSTNFARMGKVTDGAERQIRVMREQVVELRQQDLGGKADQLRQHTKTAADTASRQQIDFRTVEAIAQSLADVSRGLHTWADTVDADRLKKVSAGLGETARYLETGVADPSEKSAAELETSLAGLEKDATRLAALLRQSAPDLKAARSIHDNLASFDTGLARLADLLKPDRIATMKEGLEGLETSLSSTADQVDKVSAMSYPVVTFNGLKPTIETKSFWPEGDKVAEGLRKATKGVKAANEEMELLNKALPELDKALADSRKSVGQTREALGQALKGQEETEKLLRVVPDQTAALAETLPKLGRTMARMLRETKKLRDLAVGLRAVQATLDDTLKAWPDVARSLKNSARVLDQAHSQLALAASSRQDYEQAMRSSSQVARSLADLLPAFTDQLDSRLGQQETSLEQMESGLGELNESLPTLERQTGELVSTIRWLLYLVAGLVSLHAGYVLLDPVRGPGLPRSPRTVA